MTNTFDLPWDGERCTICRRPQFTTGRCQRCERAYQLGYTQARAEAFEEQSAMARNIWATP